jgi:site-specific DNA recombinase
MTKAPICVGYVRVSTRKQAAPDRWSLPSQRTWIAEEAARRGWKVAGVFDDPGVTGAAQLADRPGLRAALDAVRTQAAVGLLVVEAERISRGDTRDWDEVLDVLAAVGASIVTPGLCIDPRNPEDEALSGIFMVLARRERKKTAQRSARGSLERAKSGRWCGKPPFGYALAKEDGRLRPRPEQAEIVRRIFKSVTEGETYLGMADLLNAERVASSRGDAIWTAHAVRRIVMNVAYTGTASYRPSGAAEALVVEDAHPSIVGVAEYARANEAVRARSFAGVPKSRRRSDFILVGLLECPECGGRVHGQSAGRDKGNGKYTYYGHGVRVRGVRLPCRKLPSAAVENAVLAEVAAVLADPTLVAAVRRRAVADRLVEGSVETKRRAELDEEMAKMKRRIDALYEDRVEGRITPQFFAEKNSAALAREAEIRREIAEIEDRLLATGRSVDVGALVALLSDGPRVLDALSGVEKRELLWALVRRVRVVARDPIAVRLEWRLAGLDAPSRRLEASA